MVDWPKVGELVGTKTYKKMIDDGFRELAKLSSKGKKKVMGLPSVGADG